MLLLLFILSFAITKTDMFPHSPLLTSQCIYMVIDCDYVVVMVMCKVLLNSSICSFSLSHSSCLPRYNASTSGICLASVLHLASVLQLDGSWMAAGCLSGSLFLFLSVSDTVVNLVVWYWLLEEGL